MKFSGTVGFLVGEYEACPGIWKTDIVEHNYVGEVLRNSRRYQAASDKQNVDLSVSNRISILSDLYAQQNWQSIRYVTWNGVRWSITDVEVSYPRLTLTLGGVYNENSNGTT